MNTIRTQVGIVGAGPAGLMLGHLLHRPDTGNAFDSRRQHAELDHVTSSRSAMTNLAENYVGTPFEEGFVED
jgi:hypothetical protein